MKEKRREKQDRCDGSLGGADKYEASRKQKAIFFSAISQKTILESQRHFKVNKLIKQSKYGLFTKKKSEQTNKDYLQIMDYLQKYGLFTNIGRKTNIKCFGGYF